jgi:hypothetical protein
MTGGVMNFNSTINHSACITTGRSRNRAAMATSNANRVAQIAFASSGSSHSVI